MQRQPTTIRPDQSRNPRYNTKAYWTAHGTLIPKEAEIIVYTDAGIVTVDGVPKYLPAIKIGDGRSYLADLPFLGEYEAQVMLDHLNDNTRHITQQERERWNHKLNTPDIPVVNGKLILNRE
ncbi:MAG: hypothetical protein IKO09_00430 [Bacteroidales bacterium]|nr:hypothetical protein [Bacteroidales bacterium]